MISLHMTGWSKILVPLQNSAALAKRLLKKDVDPEAKAALIKERRCLQEKLRRVKRRLEKQRLKYGHFFSSGLNVR